MNYMYSIILMVQLFLVACSNKEGKLSSKCEWAHSQIVGHRAFSELNEEIPALYVAIKCSEAAFEKEYSLTLGDAQVALEKNYSTSGVIVLMADIGSIDRLFKKQIRDSTEYKETLSRLLEETKLVVRGEGKEIPKSKGYNVRYGYLEKRIR